MRNQKLTVKVLMILVIAALVLGLGTIKIAAIRSSANAEPSVVATVEGKKISAKIYLMYLRNGIDALGLSDKTDEGRGKIELLKEGIVSELIDRALIEAEVARRRLPISDKALTQQYEKTVAQMGGRDGYRAYLAEHGLTDEEFRQTIAQEIYGQLLQAELNKEVSVNELEIQEFYNKERNNPRLGDLFNDPERVHARHILIDARRSQIARDIESAAPISKPEVEQRVAGEMAKRRNLAAALLERLRLGGDFQRLALEYSDDPGTRSRGGDLGLFRHNAHTVRFDDAAFALKPGRLSDIVETEYGYHIIQVTEHLRERLRTLDETRSAIHEQLLARKQAANLRAWLETRRSEANIQIDPVYRVGQLHAIDKGLQDVR
jgi:parvulin-like peptidyl-prolyl isomerase